MNYRDALILRGSTDVCLVDDLGVFHTYSITNTALEIGDVNSIDFGDITIQNLEPLISFQEHLQKLDFTPYQSPHVKFYKSSDKLGSSVSWQIPAKELLALTELKFEMELNSEETIDRIDLNIGILATSMDYFESEIGGPYALNISYLGQDNQWITVKDKCDLEELLEQSIEGTDPAPFTLHQALNIRSVSINVSIVTRFIVITLHYLGKQDTKEAPLIKSLNAALLGLRQKGGNALVLVKMMLRLK